MDDEEFWLWIGFFFLEPFGSDRRQQAQQAADAVNVHRPSTADPVEPSRYLPQPPPEYTPPQLPEEMTQAMKTVEAAMNPPRR